MNKITAMYLDSVRTNIGKLDEIAPSRADMAERLRDYEDDLREATENLKQKHGHDALMTEISGTDREIAEQNEAMIHNGARFLVQAIAELLRAYPDKHEEIIREIHEHWRIDFYANSNVKPETYVACFDAFASHVCDPAWWDTHPIRYNDGNKSVVAVKDDMPFHWSPCFTVLFQVDLIKRNREFTDWHDKTLKELSDAWAEKFLGEAAGDDIKQKALLRALEAKYGPSDGRPEE